MTCEQVTLWLLHADSRAAPPDDVAAHLKDCRRCRRRGARLRRLDRAVRRLPVPPDNPAARARVLAGIGDGPARRELLATRTVLPGRRRWRGVLARAAAVLLLMSGFGVLALWVGGPEPPPTQPQARSHADVVGRLVDRHVQLAEGLLPDERFRVLADLAADLGNESLRLAELSAATELQAVARLYERVVGEDLVPRAAKLPAEQRRRLVLEVVAELRQTEIDAERAAAGAAPEAAVSLRHLAATAQRARLQLATLVGEKTL
jgi:hypothetical protein